MLHMKSSWIREIQHTHKKNQRKKNFNKRDSKIIIAITEKYGNCVGIQSVPWSLMKYTDL